MLRNAARVHSLLSARKIAATRQRSAIESMRTWYPRRREPRRKLELSRTRDFRLRRPRQSRGRERQCTGLEGRQVVRGEQRLDATQRAATKGAELGRGCVATLAPLGVHRAEERIERVTQLEQLGLSGARRPALNVLVVSLPAAALHRGERARRLAEEVALEQVR